MSAAWGGGGSVEKGTIYKCITWYNGDEEEIDKNGIHLTGSD